MVIDEYYQKSRDIYFINRDCDWDSLNAEIEEIIESPRCGWVEPLKIGQPIKSNYPKVRYNQRRNLNSTTIKR